MTRQEQNTIIINSLTNKLKDLPNIQQVITSKFNEWFRSLVASGQELLMQGQVSTAGSAQGGGDAQGQGQGQEA